MEILLPFIAMYLSVALIYLLGSALAAGFVGGEITYKDYIDSFLWPVSLSIITGSLIRIVVQYISNRKTTKRKK